MLAIIVRGATGVCVWIRFRSGPDFPVQWLCTRDQFTVAADPDPGAVEAVLTGLAQHSQSLVGAISQVVQLEV